jgi:hypothetical protein
VQEIAAARGQLLEQVADDITPKHLFVLPCAEPATNRAIRRALQPLAKPYPKRTT